MKNAEPRSLPRICFVLTVGRSDSQKSVISMQKTMILPVCLGILLVGIVMIPGVFAAGGCGEGTVLVDGVCQLAPVESSGCGEGTVLVNGVCQLAAPAMSLPTTGEIAGFATTTLFLVVVIGIPVIAGGVIVVIFVVRRGSSGTKVPKSARQDHEDYEEQYIAKQGQRPSRKPAETRQTSAFCDSCGAKLKSEAKFCGKCGSKQ